MLALDSLPFYPTDEVEYYKKDSTVVDKEHGCGLSKNKKANDMSAFIYL